MSYGRAMKCEHHACQKWARYEVFTDRNSFVGRFCRKHAHRTVSDLSVVELAARAVQ